MIKIMIMVMMMMTTLMMIVMMIVTVIVILIMIVMITDWSTITRRGGRRSRNFGNITKSMLSNF